MSNKISITPFFRGHRGTIWSMVTKGHRLFSAGGDKVIKVWNMENVRLARCTEVLEGHTNDVSHRGLNNFYMEPFIPEGALLLINCVERVGWNLFSH